MCFVQCHDGSNDTSVQTEFKRCTSSFSLPEQLREYHSARHTNSQPSSGHRAESCWFSSPNKVNAVGNQALGEPPLQTCTGLKFRQIYALVRATMLSLSFVFPFVLQLFGIKSVMPQRATTGKSFECLLKSSSRSHRYQKSKANLCKYSHQDTFLPRQRLPS